MSSTETAEDDEELKKKYRYWRLRIFYSIYVGYALFYFTRKSFTFAMPGLIADLGFDKADLGFLGSLLAITYGVSKFVSGMISDRSSLRYFMGLGLILTGVFNLFFGLSSSIVLFAVFLGMNGFFQGWGSPPCAKFLTYWYSQTERGRWWGLWNTSHNIGGAIIPLLCAFAIATFGWRYAMFFPGFLAIGAGLFLINRLRDTPKEVGLPSIEKFRNDYPEDKGREEETEGKLSTKELLMEHILKNKFMWILAVSFFFVYIIRTGINDWIQLYLMEDRGYTLMWAGSCVFWFEVGGIFGSLAAGYLSDTVFRGRRGPVNILFTLGIIATLGALWFLPSAGLLVISLVMFSFGFFVFGPQMLIGMAAAELVNKKAAGTATGFVGLFAYLGAACAGWPIGRITEDFGWPGFFLLLAVCGAIAVSLLLPLWSKGGRVQLTAETT
ncbi:MFS transporter family glucose-6-phosphate receptor UhpC [Candidatus Neptunochlamydia vexilliferae]|uniref:MFS transporter family glucose-6-phosphate receptor UhpC n=1 Tax=Candidatus Neptunichlamydia vexilliferae TaxID=1651774 RepID=UPI001890D443|nr:MFS transporter family glucose-6-phosphate receptor UhpC [Candidatus Neptunochlamydia vexilliferae]